MNELARILDASIERLIEHHGWQGNLAVICALHAVAQHAMEYHYGVDGLAAFNRLCDSHRHVQEQHDVPDMVSAPPGWFGNR